MIEKDNPHKLGSNIKSIGNEPLDSHKGVDRKSHIIGLLP